MTDDQDEVHAEEVDVIVEEFEVPNEETIKMTDVAWDFENTSPKAIAEDPKVTQVPVAISIPNHGDMIDFEVMPDLEDWSSKEITGEEPSVDTPPVVGPLALPWVCF